MCFIWQTTVYPVWHSLNVCVPSHFSRVWLFAILRTIALQAPLSMRFSRQEYRSPLPCPPPGDLPDPVIEPVSPALADGFFTTSVTWEAFFEWKHAIKNRRFYEKDYDPNIKQILLTLKMIFPWSLTNNWCMNVVVFCDYGQTKVTFLFEWYIPLWFTYERGSRWFIGWKQLQIFTDKTSNANRDSSKLDDVPSMSQ